MRIAIRFTDTEHGSRSSAVRDTLLLLIDVHTLDKRRDVSAKSSNSPRSRGLLDRRSFRRQLFFSLLSAVPSNPIQCVHISLFTIINYLIDGSAIISSLDNERDLISMCQSFETKILRIFLFFFFPFFSPSNVQRPNERFLFLNDTT